MTNEDRNIESILRKMLSLGGCDTPETCNCTLHYLLLRTISDFDKQRAEETRLEAQKQIDYNNLKIELDIE